MLYYLDLFGTAIFATTGVLAARKKGMDLFGGIFLGLATALGGGTFRDISIGSLPVFWVTDSSYIIIAVVFSFLIFFIYKHLERISKALLLLDTFGLAVFTIVGLQKTLHAGNSYMIATIMGVTTGVLGGVIRDMLSAEVPLILKKEIYATASLIGAITYLCLQPLISNQTLLAIISISVIITMRLTALRFGISLPGIKK